MSAPLYDGGTSVANPTGSQTETSCTRPLSQRFKSQSGTPSSSAETRTDTPYGVALDPAVLRLRGTRVRHYGSSLAPAYALLTGLMLAASLGPVWVVLFVLFAGPVVGRSWASARASEVAPVRPNLKEAGDRSNEC